MEISIEQLKRQLSDCRKTLNKGYTNAKHTGMSWLDCFCGEFLALTRDVHKLIDKDVGKLGVVDNDHVETIFLCLTQIMYCIRHMERTLKAEQTIGTAISASRQHFLDRINWCLDRLWEALKGIADNPSGTTKDVAENNTFVELMDLVLDDLSPYSSYKEEESKIITNVAEQNAEAMFASKEIRLVTNLILGHTLAFANVALKEDKKALSALCQKVLRECIAFQEECSLNEEQRTLNESSRKLKAISLENALYQLEDYINEALLRLVYTCFLDYQRFSIEKMRTALRKSGPDDTALDELIADFDVNIDRTTQIGIFAIAFAPNVKMKTIVRSCLASLESLDSCIIPSLQNRNTADLYSEILEQHFNEEISNFQHAIQEIIDSHAFTSCYYELLTQCITHAEKVLDKKQLEDVLQMGTFLHEHFQYEVNNKELRVHVDRLKLYEKFITILHECQAILCCADQVDVQRILKRFKILRSVLHRFLDTFSDSNTVAHKARSSNFMLLSDELSESQQMFASIGISPSICSILYCNASPMRKRAVSDSLRGNSSKWVPTPLKVQEQSAKTSNGRLHNSAFGQFPRSVTCSLRRKESLRTAMFKRQKSNEAANIYKAYRSNSTSLQISDILDQITNLSAGFSAKSRLDETNIEAN